jgi:hypothetical protein
MLRIKELSGRYVTDGWFHGKCQGVADDTYKLLKKNQGVHCSCKACKCGVAKILRLVLVLQRRMDKAEKKQGKIEQIVEELKQQVSNMQDKNENKMKVQIEKECNKK